MVNVSSKNNEISINISTAGNKSNIKLDTPQNYYENLAKHWAVSEKLVNGEDYSSKHYANESKQQAILAKEKANIAVVKAQEVLDNGNKALLLLILPEQHRLILLKQKLLKLFKRNIIFFQNLNLRKITSQ